MSVDADDPRLPSVLDASLCTEPAVEFMIAFGSRTTGEATPASDLDVAVKFADDLSSRERFDTQCFLSADLQSDDVPFVDLSDIETLPVDVAHDAVNGTLVCGDESAFEEYKASVESAFADEHETLRRQQRDVIDRIAAEGLRG